MILFALFLAFTGGFMFCAALTSNVLKMGVDREMTAVGACVTLAAVVIAVINL